MTCDKSKIEFCSLKGCNCKCVCSLKERGDLSSQQEEEPSYRNTSKRNSQCLQW